MHEYTSQIITKTVNNVINSNTEAINHNMFNNITDNMTLEQAVPIMIANSISISADIAVKIILEILDTNDILPIDIDEDTYRKLIIKPVK